MKNSSEQVKGISYISFYLFIFGSVRQGSLFNSLGYVPFFIFYINALKKLLSYFIYCIMFSWNFPWATNQVPNNLLRMLIINFKHLVLA